MAGGEVSPQLKRNGNEVYEVTLTGMGQRMQHASKNLGVETAINEVTTCVVVEIAALTVEQKTIAAIQTKLQVKFQIVRPQSLLLFTNKAIACGPSASWAFGFRHIHFPSETARTVQASHLK